MSPAKDPPLADVLAARQRRRAELLDAATELLGKPERADAVLTLVETAAAVDLTDGQHNRPLVTAAYLLAQSAVYVLAEAMAREGVPVDTVRADVIALCAEAIASCRPPSPEMLAWVTAALEGFPCG